MDIVLIHGMGRTPLSMLRLRHHLRQHGHRVYLFGYIPALESLSGVTRRLVALVQTRIGQTPYALVGHSLGCVLIRNALPRLQSNPPCKCFFMAPPMRVCRAAKFFARNWIYRLVTGEMGQLLSQETFMSRLPIPDHLTIYAGTAGPRVAWYPLADEVNDSILTISEVRAELPVRMILLPSLHTFIMHSEEVREDILDVLRNSQNVESSK